MQFGAKAGKPRNRVNGAFGGSAGAKTIEERVNRRVAAIAKTSALACETAPTKARRNSRAADRPATFKFGRLETPHGEFLSCIIRDLTANGARIALEGAQALSGRVVLHIQASASRRSSNVAWTSEKEAGLCFID